jgi:hypothetical protein
VYTVVQSSRLVWSTITSSLRVDDLSRQPELCLQGVYDGARHCCDILQVVPYDTCNQKRERQEKKRETRQFEGTG